MVSKRRLLSSPVPSHVHIHPPAHFQVSSLCRTSRGHSGRRVGVHSYGWVPEANPQAHMAQHHCWDWAELYNLLQRLTAAVLGCRGALGEEHYSQALGSIFPPAETFCLGRATVFGTHNPGLLPVMSVRPFIISWEELLPKKMERRRNIPGGRVVFWHDEEGLALNLILKLETGSFHCE